MTCKNCNAPLEEQARFCVKCGASVPDLPQDQPPQATRQDAMERAIQPKKTDSPVRPPKRPQPGQLTIQKQSVDEGQREPETRERLQPQKIDKDNNSKPAVEIDKEPMNIVHEQPTLIVPSDTHDAHASLPAEKRGALYEQSTLIVKRDDISLQDAAPITPHDVPTLPFEIHSVPHPELIEVNEPDKTGEGGGQRPVALSSPEPAQPLLYYRLNTTTKGSQKLPAVVNRTAYNRGRRRGCAGCILSGLATLIVLVIVVGALWIFALRPYAHNIAQRELDNALTSAVNQLPPQAAQLPAGSTIPINENIINNLIVLNIAPSNPVQHPTTSISGQNIRLDFQLYSLPCAVTMVPTLNNGRLVVNKVGVEGVFAAIMSPEEMTTLLNKHLSDAQTKLQRTITTVQLKDHEVDLTLG